MYSQCEMYNVVQYLCKYHIGTEDKRCRKLLNSGRWEDWQLLTGQFAASFRSITFEEWKHASGSIGSSVFVCLVASLHMTNQ